MLRLITRTKDGSPTYFVPRLNEYYHSLHGAIQESDFVFIDKALRRMEKTSIRLFELGFGTGLNAYLTCLEAENTKKEICYHSIEPYPLEKSEWLEFKKHLPANTPGSSQFRRIHECIWGKEVRINHFFRLKKIKDDINSYPASGTYDVIYFDAFGPDVQPELWTEEIFRKISAMMVKGAVLSTYSSKGEVRRNMQRAGLVVERLPGPPGKRQIIAAFKP